ncbi:MAG: GAF domain-containing protein [Dehalococcoidia bacterium]
MTAPDMNQTDEIARLQAEVIALRTARDEGHQRESVTAEVLQAMGRSVADLQSVLDALVINAARLVDSDYANISITHDASLLFVSLVRDGHILPTPRVRAPRISSNVLLNRPFPAEALSQRRTIAVHGGAGGIAERYPYSAEVWRRSLTPFGSAICVPLLRGSEALGLLMVNRVSPDPYTPRQVALLESFADQAVIAMENARLFEEVQSRTHEVEARNTELAEALEQQTAVSEVLRLIGSRPGDLEGVMTALIARASQRVGADSGWISRITVMGEQTYVAWRYLYDAAHHLKMDTGLRERLLSAGRRLPGTVAREERRPVQVWGTLEEIRRQYPDIMLGTVPQVPQCWLFVPLIRDGEAIGLFAFYRWRPEPFSEQQIAWAQTFADQAVIAIENARLFEEIQQKSRELEEANVQLEAATQAKSAFLSSMSHELRTPLNAVIGYSAMLQDEATDAGDDRFVADLEKINAAGKHLLSLISNVLDLSKIEAGRMDLFPSSFEVARFITEVEAVAQPLVAKNGNSLAIQVAPEPAPCTPIRRSCGRRSSTCCRTPPSSRSRERSGWKCDGKGAPREASSSPAPRSHRDLALTPGPPPSGGEGRRTWRPIP